MDNHHEAVIAKIVAFVFVHEDDADDPGTEFTTPEELFAHVEGLQKGQRLLFDKGVVRWPEVGVEYKTKLELPDGSFTYDIGAGGGTKIGEVRYGTPCTKCRKLTWWGWDCSKNSKVLCVDCSEADDHIPDDIEYFDIEH